MAAAFRPFEPDMPIGWLIDFVNFKVGLITTVVSKNLIDAISPLFFSLYGIYFLMLGLNYMRGGELPHVSDFIQKLIAWSLLIGIGFNYATYNDFVMPIAGNIGNDLARLLTGNASMASSYDAMFINIANTITKGFSSVVDHASWYEVLNGQVMSELMSLALTAVILFIGVLPFVAVAASFTIVANVSAQLVLALGPLFFGLALFPATRQYFSSWINTVFSYALIPVLISIVAVMASEVSMTIMGVTVPPKGEPPILIEVSPYLALVAAFTNWVFIFLLRQVASIASSLSAGGISAGMYDPVRHAMDSRKQKKATDLAKRAAGGGSMSNGGKTPKAG